MSPSAGADRLLPRVVEVCDAVGAFIEVWGFKSIHGRVWALLALSRAPLAQTEIAETLGVSRSLVNLAVGELVSYGLVRAVGEHRNAPYEARVDVWPTITDVLRSREWMLMERARVALDAALSEAQFLEESGRSPRFEVRRLQLLLAMTEFGQASLRMIMAVRMPRTADAFTPWLSRAARAVRKLQDSLPKLL